MPPRALPFTLHTSKTKTILLLLLSVAFVAIGVWMLMREGSVMGWVCTGFFGLCALTFAIRLLPGASYLKVTEDGIELASLFRVTRFRWSEFERFAPYTLRFRGLPTNALVGIHFSQSYRGASQVARSIARAASSGFDGALPDTYGMPAEDLAAMLNAIREQQGAKQAAPTTDVRA